MLQQLAREANSSPFWPKFNRFLGNMPDNVDMGFQAKLNYGLYMLLASSAGVVVFGYQLFKYKGTAEKGKSNESDVLT